MRGNCNYYTCSPSLPAMNRLAARWPNPSSATACACRQRRRLKSAAVMKNVLKHVRSHGRQRAPARFPYQAMNSIHSRVKRTVDVPRAALLPEMGLCYNRGVM
jgi:hypothetical protein